MNILTTTGNRLVIGHRGTAACAPENTREGIALALAHGADAVEFDVRLSADGEVVLFHDPTVERTTGASGAVRDMTFAQLLELDAGARFEPASPNAPVQQASYPVPRLDDILGEFEDAPMIIEIKDASVAEATRSLIERHGAEHRCLVDSLDAANLRAFHGSRIATGGGKSGVVSALMHGLIGVGIARGSSSAYCIPLSYGGFPIPVRTVVRDARKTSRVVHVWTVNDPSVALELWAAGVTGIITDDVVPVLHARSHIGLSAVGP